MKMTIALSLLTAVLALTGCNTMRGLGQDIEKAGSALEKSAK